MKISRTLKKFYKNFEKNLPKFVENIWELCENLEMIFEKFEEMWIQISLREKHWKLFHILGGIHRIAFEIPQGTNFDILPPSLTSPKKSMKSHRLTLTSTIRCTQDIWQSKVVPQTRHPLPGIASSGPALVGQEGTLWERQLLCPSDVKNNDLYRQLSIREKSVTIDKKTENIDF